MALIEMKCGVTRLRDWCSVLAENNACVAFDLIKTEMPHRIVGGQCVLARNGRSHFSQ